MINRVTLMGNLGSDPELREMDGGIRKAKVNIATTSSYKDKSGEWQDETEWHTIAGWNAIADRLAKCKKGDRIYAEGKLTHRSYEKDGITRYFTEVILGKLINLAPKEKAAHSTLTEDPF